MCAMGQQVMLLLVLLLLWTWLLCMARHYLQRCEGLQLDLVLTSCCCCGRLSLGGVPLPGESCAIAVVIWEGYSGITVSVCCNPSHFSDLLCCCFDLVLLRLVYIFNSWIIVIHPIHLTLFEAD